jgi:hypothetical protein
MAQINKNKSIVGSIGQVVFKEVGKKQILQSKPTDMKQTKRTKESGSEFRQCSSWTKPLRFQLSSFLSNHTDSFMHSRLAGKFYTTLQANTELAKGVRSPMNSDMLALAGFEFNTNSPFPDYFMPTINAVLNDQNEIVITIPAFNPKVEMLFAENTSHADLLIYVMASNFEPFGGFDEGYTVVPIENKYQTKAETIWTSPPMPQGKLVLVCAKLLFYNPNRFTEKQYINSKECSPAQIVMVGR